MAHLKESKPRREHLPQLPCAPVTYGVMEQMDRESEFSAELATYIPQSDYENGLQIGERYKCATEGFES